MKCPRCKIEMTITRIASGDHAGPPGLLHTCDECLYEVFESDTERRAQAIDLAVEARLEERHE